MSSFKRRYYGKYRGVVADNVDLDQQGRITATVLDVLGDVPTTWALPCLPVTGMIGLQSGMYVVPPIKANVWIEFEHGDVNKPIWSGCYWGDKSQIPTAALNEDPATPPILMQSVGQNSVMIGGDPLTGITISCGPAELTTSPQITLDPTGITLSVGACSIKISVSSVSINDGALNISLV
jgi:Type VI secretion system/phage-baseplate injector OB domain